MQSTSHHEPADVSNVLGDTNLLSNSTESGNQNAISSGDLGRIVHLRNQLSDQQKYFLLKKHFDPSINYKFPACEINKLQRHFQYTWLKKNPGLVYSESQNGGYCKYPLPSVSHLGVFVNNPFTNFKKVSEFLGQHFHGFGN